MKEQTKYRYEQRIKELHGRMTKAEDRNHFYKDVLSDLYEHFCNCSDGASIDLKWTLRQFKRIWMR